jgi:acyl-coenzyme A thioesterase PaaI-like protein
VVSAATGGFREMATTNCTTSFLRPVAGRDVIARGKALKTGRLLVFGEVLLYADGEEEPAAQATCTYALPPPR